MRFPRALALPLIVICAALGAWILPSPLTPAYALTNCDVLISEEAGGHHLKEARAAIIAEPADGAS